MLFMANLFQQSRRNLARWFTLSMGSILVVFAASVYVLDAQGRLHAFDTELENKARVMAGGIQYRLRQGRLQPRLDHVPMLGSNTLPLDSKIAYARWYSRDGKLARFARQQPLDPFIHQLGFETVTLPDSPTQEQSLLLRQLTFPVKHEGVLIGYLQIAVPLTSLQQTLDQLRLLLTLGVPMGLGLITLTGWWLGGVAMQPLQQSYRRLHHFTTNASHELRTPLAKVLGHAQLGLMPASDIESGARLRLEKIVHVTRGMSRLVGDLLFLARHEGRLNSEDLELIDLTKLVQELAWDVASLAQTKTITVDCDLPGQAVRVAADPDLLGQAITNLTDNAIKYSPPHSRVQLRLMTQGRWAVVQVNDNGPGIPADALPYIFDRFYRVNATRSQSEGFGLGLAIAQQIVQAHGGQITVQSESGKGSCFELTLPRQMI
jgi:signal transduction histidine kinase